MKTVFDLGPDEKSSDENSLLLETGPDYCLYAYLHKPSNTITRLKLISFEETAMEESLSAILDGLRDQAGLNVQVCSGFPQALLVPAKHFNNEASLLESVYGMEPQADLHDAIPEWQMVNAYRLPKPVYRRLQHSFPAAAYCHAYTPAIKMYNGFMADTQLSVHFTQNHFRVLLKKESNLHLAQTYAYRTPLDVVYFLLKISLAFDLNQQGVFVILSGLVERESNLYTELQQYFGNIHFAQTPSILFPDSGLPQHFFTSLYNLAACAS